MAEPWNWTCAFCGRDQTVTTNGVIDEQPISVATSKYGAIGARLISIACANPECMELTLKVDYVKTSFVASARYFLFSNDVVFSFDLRPESTAKSQPDYLPASIRQDYVEACRIRDLSPKASATLSRRCLQGMIRDFCDISKSRLIDEIRELRARIDTGSAPPGVQADTVDAIDAVREVGNIAAHMERDINVIVDVDPGEAQSLIALLELLFDEWYVARHQRQERIAAVRALAGAKQVERTQGSLPPPAPQLPPPDPA